MLLTIKRLEIPGFYPYFILTGLALFPKASHALIFLFIPTACSSRVLQTTDELGVDLRPCATPFEGTLYNGEASSLGLSLSPKS